jgi:hypothetical protein
MRTLLLPAALLLLAGCASAYVAPPPAADHPASPLAAAAPFTPPADALASSFFPAGPAPAGPDAGTLPPEAAAHLAHVLGAYAAIGDRLAGDAVDGIAEQARALGGMLDALVAVELPDAPHLWHEQAGAVQVIRDEARALAAVADLHAARVAYGRLSEALGRLVAVTGVPGGGSAPTHRFVCGMFADAPRGGVWLQAGEEPRNPYFGGRMLGCHSEKTRLSAPGASPAGEHGGPHQPGTER